MRRTVAPTLAALLAVLAVVACSTRAAPDRVDHVTVLAAASLTDVFTSIGADFEKANPGVRVSLAFGSSSTLAQQIVNGAPADVFAAANEATMRTVADAGLLAAGPIVIARNQLVIAVAPGNPRRVRSLADLADPSISVVWCATTAPCGAAAQAALRAANVVVTPVSLEPDVRAALTKVSLGEVDAALVYRTDTRGAQVSAVEFAESAQAINTVQVGVLVNASTTATELVGYIRSPAGLAVLTEAGFLPP
jgi:molybdate transport system substrate-binding protein